MEHVPSSLRTGFGDGAPSGKIDKNSPLGKRLISLVFVLVKRAAMTAALYTSHSKRTMVTPDDVMKALRYHAVSFLSEDGFDALQTDVESMEDLVNQFAQDEADEEEVVDTFIDEADEMVADEVEAEEETAGGESYDCPCDICTGVRELEWELWQPTDPAEQFIKHHVDELSGTL